MSKIDTSNKNTINDIEDDIEDDIESQSNPEVKKISNNDIINICISWCPFFIVILFCLPTIICDLYFAYNSISCQHNLTPIGINLSTWLQVSVFYWFGYVVSAFILGILTPKYKFIKQIRELKLRLTLWFYFVWNIIGCIMYWKYLQPSGTCDSDVSSYIVARLISYIITVFIGILMGICIGISKYQKERQSNKYFLMV